MIFDEVLILHSPKTATEIWLKSIVIAHNFCPFAKQTVTRNSIRFSTVDDTATDICLQLLIDECERLDTDETIETSLLIYSTAFADFEDYLDFLAYAEALLTQQGYDGIYQLASFHPNYCFDGAELDDPANYTNRSPYPMLHLLRESSIERALINVADPESIPQQNVVLTRKMGLAKMRDLLVACY
ncbi:DUF1415 domain-containing protein [Crenothrix polyspora]|uniref:DUF1415 domain-containing protein n=1 Tax=Crenothrix polyspora TaxID=360316 RepID=A0A1R4H6V7_9GAMM|nr:DUF1415 domain-containing protein [Crenothrix polyspora]SJM91916.1 conserved hypothetical protein [Crenothrix polyspora]